MTGAVVEVMDLIDKDVWRHVAGRRRIGRCDPTASANNSTDKRWERNKQQDTVHGGEGTTLNVRFMTRPHWLFCDMRGDKNERPGISAKLIGRLANLVTYATVTSWSVSPTKFHTLLTNAHIYPSIPGFALSVFEKVWSLRFKLVTGRGERETALKRKVY